MIIEVEITGVSPLLQNKFNIEKHDAGASKQKKKVYDPNEEAEKACYRNAEGILCHPSEHIYSSLAKAGTDFKFSGKKSMKDVLKAGLILSPELIPLGVDKYDIDTRRVVIQRASVAKWRPRYEQWKLNFQIEIIDDDNIRQSDLKEILDRAGKFYGIGDYRPRFGRFQVTKWNVIK